jgi:N-acetylglucosamine-6-phosphate deacetylase
MSASMRQAIAAATVFDGVTRHQHAAVLIEGTQIVAVVPRQDVPAAVPVHDMRDGLWLAPGFVDLQVNGGGDVLFNNEPTVEAILRIAAAHRKFGTTSLLPTLITDVAEKTEAAIAAIEAAMQAEPAVLGLHLEGPFLSPEKPGVHDRTLIRRPTAADLAMLAVPRRGALLVTLAPEDRGRHVLPRHDGDDLRAFDQDGSVLMPRHPVEHGSGGDRLEHRRAHRVRVTFCK